MDSSLPIARTPDPYTAPPLRWGIIAPGGIAGSMARAMQRSTQQVVAVGSRSAERAQQFADAHGIAKAHGSYEQLVADPNVQAVYIASPHSEHRDQALLAIAAGKPVLVEKAFTQNRQQAQEVVTAAQAAGVLVVEAMWPRFAPRYDVVRQLLNDGALGDLVLVQADHSQALPATIERLYRPELAGGALLDLGIYPVSFMSFVLGGQPDRLQALGTLTDTGVDLSVALSAAGFAHHPRALASLTSTMGGATSVPAVIVGTEGRIELDNYFYAPGPVRLVRNNGDVLEAPSASIVRADALVYEACHVAQLVADGQTDSPLMPAAESVAIMGTLDRIRDQVGVSFPGEHSPLSAQA